jgi:hypothetical protein
VKIALYLLWAIGLALLLGLIAYYGFGDVAAAIGVAGWGVLWVVAYRLVPLLADTLGWRALLPLPDRRPLHQLVRMRWIADSINTLLPVAQVGGELVRAQLLHRTGVPGPMAGASAVVDLTAAVLTQVGFALLGVALLVQHGGAGDAVLGIAVGIGMFSCLLIGFYLAQRAGMFESLARVLERVARGRRQPFWIACAWRFAFWLLGTGEVWLAMYLLGHPIGLGEALILESLGVAVRAAAFAVPGALGVQEGAFILLGALVGVPSETALALSLVKRVRELALGLPGLIVWQLGEGHRLLRRGARSVKASGQLSKP